MTGLYNDRYLNLTLSRTIEKCANQGDDLAVIFLDLDYFKQVNDTYGHLAGSQVLREVGHLLKAQIRGSESIPARYGGDEFVIAIPRLSLDAALDLAEAIRNTIIATVFCAKAGDIQPEPLNLSGITCSLGVATLDRHVEPAAPVEVAKSTLLRLADMAMYVAKKTGRNRTAVAGEPIRRRSAASEPRA